MSAGFLQRLFALAQAEPGAPALEQLDDRGRRRTVADYRGLIAKVADAAELLSERGIRPGARVGLAVANSPTWVELDLALQLIGAVSIPVPLSFSRAQVSGLLAGAAWIIVDRPGAAWLDRCGLAARARSQPGASPGPRVVEVERWPARPEPPPARVAELWAAGIAREDQTLLKIIHTSGTTGTPKGVKISRRGMDLQSIALGGNIRRHLGPPRYLSLLPASLLIEQLFAINVTLVAGGSVVLLAPSVGPLGDGRTPAETYLDFVGDAAPSLLMVPPAIVDVLAARQRREQIADAAGWRAALGVDALPMICCGGAPTSARALAQLWATGLPVYEGYGLSEASAVVCWNQPGATKLGTVGRPSAHNQVELAADGELLIRSPAVFLGYEGRDQTALDEREGWLATGDVATIDADGYVTVLGRKKDMIITSTGRNVSPAWVERMLVDHARVARASVFGDGLEQLAAVVEPEAGIGPRQLAAALAELNRELPAFAQIERFWPVQAAVYRDFSTAKRGVDRAAMWAHFGPRLGEALAVAPPTPTPTPTPIPTPTPTPTMLTATLSAAHPSTTPADLDDDALLTPLARDGFVLARGLALDLDRFSRFVRRFCARVTFDPARAGVVGVAQQVDAGYDAVGLHLENGFTAFPPELVFFYCETAAREGSQTTVCDGCEVWAQLSDATRAYFETHDLKVRRVIPEPIWRAYVANELDGIASPAAVTRADLDRMLARGPQQLLTMLDDGSIDYAVIVPGKTHGLFDARPAFANSLLGPHYNYEPPTITDPGDRPIPAEIMAEVRSVTAAVTREIAWRDGDLVMIDNRRVMHGRRAILDPARKLYIGLGHRC